MLRLDSADGRWEVDLDMGKSNGHGLRYMKGNILKSCSGTEANGGSVPIQREKVDSSRK